MLALQANDAEEFMKLLEEHYPDTDWDNLPPLEKQPKSWGVFWLRHHIIYDMHHESIRTLYDNDRQLDFETEAEADQFIQDNKQKWKSFSAPQYHDNFISIFGPLVKDSMQKIQEHSHEILELYTYKDIRERILKGEEGIFPIFIGP